MENIKNNGIRSMNFEWVEISIYRIPLSCNWALDQPANL